MNRGFFKHLILAGLISVLAACGATKVQQEVLMPAREAGMQNAKKLAVFNISGDNGAFTAQVESFIANIKVNGKPYFEILERQMLDKIMAEQRMVSGSGLFNEKDAVKLGDLAGADTLIMGGVQMPNVSVRNYQKPEQYCRARNNRGECYYWGTKYRPCTDMSASVRFTLKAVSVQKGSIIFTKTYEGQSTNSFCEGGGIPTDILSIFNEVASAGGTRKSEHELQSEAIKKVLDGLRQDVAPYTVVMTIEFMDSDDVMDKGTVKTVEQALEFVKHKRLDRACEIMKTAAAGAPNSPAVMYNMGVCAEVTSDLDRADEFYKKADRNTTKPHKLISAAINRVTEMRAKKQEVSKQIR